MALSERHWILGTLLACAVIAAMKLPPAERVPAPRRPSATTPETRARDRLRTHLRRETMTLALLERRDSLMRRLGAAARSGTSPSAAPVTIHDPDIPIRMRERIDHHIARELRGAGGRLDGGRVAVRVLADTGASLEHWGDGYTRAGWIDVEYVLPPATDGRTCLAIVRVGDRALESIASPDSGRELQRIVDRAAGSFLGPCAFLGAHGPPGTEIERWLATTDFSLALRASTPESDSQRNRLRFTPRTAIGRWLRRAGWSMERAFLHGDLVRCAEGDRQSCIAALGAPRLDGVRRDSPWLSADDLGRSGFGLPLGPAEHWFLADMQQHMGAEAFGRFWRSPLEPQAAFSEVMGITLAESTRDWARATYDAHPRRSWPHPLALAGQLLVVGGLVGGAAARRRSQGS
jgi:hypothetical protein